MAEGNMKITKWHYNDYLYYVILNTANEMDINIVI